MKHAVPLFLTLASPVFLSTLWAGESMFTRVVLTDTVPAKHFQIRQAIRHRTERSAGRYRAFDGRTEFEYGANHDYQVSLSLNSGYVNAENAPDEHPPTGFSMLTTKTGFIQGASAEFLYRFSSPVMTPLGVALAIQLGFDRVNPRNGQRIKTSLNNEIRLIFQKNFNDDQVIVGFNTSHRLGASEYPNDLSATRQYAWSNELGAIVRVASNWFAGLELRNENNRATKRKPSSHNAHSTYWAGPVLHYGARRVWVTAGALYQAYGTPNGLGDNGQEIGDDQFLRSNEKWEYNLKFGFPF